MYVIVSIIDKVLFKDLLTGEADAPRICALTANSCLDVTRQRAGFICKVAFLVREFLSESGIIKHTA